MLENDLTIPMSIDGGAQVNVLFRCIERNPGHSIYKNALFLDGSTTLEMRIDIKKKDPKASGTSNGVNRAEIIIRIKGNITNAVGQEVPVDLIEKIEISRPVGFPTLAYGTLQSAIQGFLSSSYKNRVLQGSEY